MGTQEGLAWDPSSCFHGGVSWGSLQTLGLQARAIVHCDTVFLPQLQIRP